MSMRFRLVTKVGDFLTDAATIDGAIHKSKSLSRERCDSVYVKDHDEPSRPVMKAIAEAGKAHWVTSCKKCNGVGSSAAYASCPGCDGSGWRKDQPAE